MASTRRLPSESLQDIAERSNGGAHRGVRYASFRLPVDRPPRARRRNLMEARGGLKPYLIRALAGSGALQAAGMAATFLVGLQLARGLGPGGYGQYGIAMAMLTLAAVPSEFGLPQLVTREVAAASARDQRERIFGVITWADRVVLTLAIPLSVLIAVGAWLVLDSRTVAIAVVVGAFAIPLVAFAKIRGAALQGLHFVVLGQTPITLLRPLLMSLMLAVLFLLMPDADASEAMALNVATAAVAVVFAHAWLQGRLPRPRPTRVEQDKSGWLRSALPMATTAGMRTFQPQIGILLLGLLASSHEVGIFRVALSTAVMVAVPIGLINTVIGPQLARLHAEGDWRRLQQLCSRSAQLMTAVVFVLALPFLLYGSPLLSLVFGDDCAPANTALMILCLAQLASAMFGPNALLLVMAGNERRVTRAIAAALIVNPAILLLLVPSLGQVGAAWAAGAGLLTWNAIAWWDAYRIVGVNTFFLSAGLKRIEPTS